MTLQQTRFVPAPPVTPGEFLRDRILVPLGITQDQLAAALQVSRFSVNQIVNGRRSVTADMALRLAKVTSTSSELWLNLQRDLDLYEAQLELARKQPQLTVLRQPKEGSELIVDVEDD
ncbi:MAG: addiction module antidote protein, HigA family [Mesorhizobium sp.]|uniref:HigA family addiction module antitoxin n=4 Tax=unclassified Mesorhizobium TaxID=325217 RepID=UPI000FE9809B|nr:HigA family addiction module antitoxin [Mesorhizobium sp.]RWF83186.1 MAG: addiction module antidote protein, HigA family [Mesorhizobium sp.]RWG06745.1 MAG: addiction module antidote protein, HigA family [Mesorhizobium sp.]RWG84047.1 MAG: addiction module antidote protein, HigA family [Mesorhizobium sp.]RWH07451.1 MAG: addiction module antidote protein, HigA family [Mesorhizobium sp.]RWH08281.1 MAG: addiction module antidote protein, HigA family [Mesorhizobium sp.]